jgi:hypothetical protein
MITNVTFVILSKAKDLLFSQIDQRLGSGEVLTLPINVPRQSLTRGLDGPEPLSHRTQRKLLTKQLRRDEPPNHPSKKGSRPFSFA